MSPFSDEISQSFVSSGTSGDFIHSMYTFRIFHNQEEAEERPANGISSANPSVRLRHFLFAIVGCFFILLLLYNLDYGADKNHMEQTNDEAIQTHKDKRDITGRADVFDCVDLDCSVVTCSGGEVINLDFKLESFAFKCQQPFAVILRDCSFKANRLDTYVLEGTYQASSLTIDNCELAKIDNSAFKQDSMKKVTKLTLKKSRLRELTAYTFEGLSSLLHFELYNEAADSTPLLVKGFLKPLAAILTNVELQFIEQKMSAFNNPGDWLDGAKLSKLEDVKMQGNNFGDVLTKDSFKNLVSVIKLNLQDCRITAFAENTFDVLGTLRELDLSGNQLTTLDGNFIQQMKNNLVKVDLSENEWNCDCDDLDFMEFMETYEFSGGALCATPDKFKGMEVKEVASFHCGAGIVTSTTPIASTTTTTIPTTTTLIRQPKTTTTNLPTTTSIKPTIPHISPPLPTTISPAITKTTPMNRPEPPPVTPPPPHPTPPPTTTTEEPSFCRNHAPRTSLWCCCLADQKPVETFTCNNDASFRVEAKSSSSVRLFVYDTMHNLTVIHFTVNNYTDQPEIARLTHIAATSPRDYQTIIVLDIGDLLTNRSYVFCLVPNGEITISPFNCRSQFLYVNQMESNVWLYKDDRGGFYGVSVLCILLSIFLGLLAMRGVLRWRPRCVRGQPRLRPLELTAHQMLLLPKPTRASMDAELSALNNLANMKTYDYMQITQSRDSMEGHRPVHVSDSAPPRERAPALPPIKESMSLGNSNEYETWQLPGGVNADEGPSGSNRQSYETQESEYNEYESLDYYQKIYA